MDSLDVRAISVDTESGSPPFEQVRAHIAGLIARGDLAAGTKLPTVRQLAADLGLAANTAARVYRELESDGLVGTFGRRGTFVSSEVTDRGAHSDVADRAHAATADYVHTVRLLGLRRAEAVQLVDQCWQDK